MNGQKSAQCEGCSGLYGLMLSAVVWLFVVWLAHAWSASAFSLPVVILSRNRVHWRLWELSALVFPFALWTTLLDSQLGPAKSMSNFAIELSLITLAVPIAALIRAAVGKVFAERATAAVLILGLAANAAAVYYLVPSLPE